MTEDPFSTGAARGARGEGGEVSPDVSGAPVRWWMLALERAAANRKVRASLAMLVALALGSAASPLWATHLIRVGPTDQNLVLGPQPPLTRAALAGGFGAGSPQRTFHWFGTDELGRDLLVRVGYGGRVSLAVGVAGGLVALALGMLYGAALGFAPARIGRWMEAPLVGVRCLPLLLFALVAVWLADLDLTGLCLALGCVLWFRIAREIGERIRRIREGAFVDAARVCGASEWAIVRRHVVPNVAPWILVGWVFTVPTVMLAEALLSFVELGVRAPHSSWGTLAAEGAATMDLFPWLMLFPGMALALTVVALRWLGEGLRSALASLQGGEGT